jgi:hypothetical protein
LRLCATRDQSHPGFPEGTCDAPPATEPRMAADGVLWCVHKARGDGASGAERAQYEELKLKLRTAMADMTLVDELEEVSERASGSVWRVMAGNFSNGWTQSFKYG